MTDDLLEIESQVYGFLVLLFSQMLFTQMFNMEEEKEFERIKPVVKKLENAMTEEMRIDGQNKAINFKGLTDPLIYNGIQDFWYYVYTISNYRIHAIEMPKSNPFEGQQDEELFFFALTNVVVKSHKIHRQFNQRFV